ncbi:NAD(P)-binding protein [Stipitochalara longipes BDJ]|nr:NAD(P)-binding protein [Stipitochalara longipes BDJ]
MSEKILLTGGTGMLGFQILIQALQKGYKARRNEAVQGVTAVLHVAFPLPKAGITDYESQLIQPAVRGTTGMLKSAMKTTTIRRIVITASIGSIAPAEKLLTGDSLVVYNEKSACPSPRGSFANPLDAYLGSKVIAFQAVGEFIAKEKPAYEVINILPGYIIGRNDLVTDSEHFLQGTNRMAFGQILGQPSLYALPSITAYAKDAARAHVLSLDPQIPGNQSFVISSDGLHGTTWGDAIDIIRDHYSDKVIKAAGFELDAGKTPTARVSMDSTYSQNILGFEFKSYKEQVLSLSNHYLELLKLKESQ